MTYNPQIHHRRSIRLKDYDYSQEGAYFVTICTHERHEFFGKIIDGTMRLEERGKIAQNVWYTLPASFPGIDLDHCIVMPNHIHGIIVRTESTEAKPSSSMETSPTEKNALQQYRSAPNRSQSLKEIMRAYKSRVSHDIHTSNTPDFGWHREYYDHIIRNTRELEFIRAYIVNNPQKWHQDKLHPKNKTFPMPNPNHLQK